MSLWRDTLPEMMIGRAASVGAEGGAWLERLDTMVAELENRWSIHVEQVASGGSHVFVGLDATLRVETTQWFQAFLPEAYAQLERPCPQKVLRTAMAYLEAIERRTDPAGYALIHGDAHNNNMLRVPGTPTYKFIDPDGSFYEKGYDVGVLMREWPEEYAAKPRRLGKERCRYLSQLTGVDERDIGNGALCRWWRPYSFFIKMEQKQHAQRMLDIAVLWC